MDTDTRENRMPARTRLTLFRNPSPQFEKHLREHFLNEKELWLRSPSAQFLAEIAQNWRSGTVSLVVQHYATTLPRSRVEDVELLDTGKEFAEGKPLFVRCRMAREASVFGNAFYLLAERGFVVSPVRDCVNTVSFLPEGRLA